MTTIPRSWTLGHRERHGQSAEAAAATVRVGGGSEKSKPKPEGKEEVQKPSDSSGKAPPTALEKLKAQETALALDKAIDAKAKEIIKTDREAALRKALLGGRTSALDLPAFDPNAPRGGAGRGGGYLTPLELLMRERKEGKLGLKGEEDGSALGEKSDPKVLWKELMKIEHLHKLLKVFKAAEADRLHAASQWNPQDHLFGDLSSNFLGHQHQLSQQDAVRLARLNNRMVHFDEDPLFLSQHSSGGWGGGGMQLGRPSLGGGGRSFTTGKLFGGL